MQKNTPEIIEWAHEQLKEAQASLRGMEEQGNRYFVQVRGSEAVEVTEGWIARDRATVERMTNLIHAYRNSDA